MSFCSEGMEALALWQGIEAVSGSDLLQQCGSLDIGPSRGSSQAAETLSGMQDACKVGGITILPRISVSVTRAVCSERDRQGRDYAMTADSLVKELCFLKTACLRRQPGCGLGSLTQKECPGCFHCSDLLAAARACTTRRALSCTAALH